MARDCEIKVRLSEDELAIVDEMRNGVSRAAYLRSLIRRPPDAGEVADRTEALAILSAPAREGRTMAAIALEPALRGEGTGSNDELERLLHGTD
jgi:hypothetical protein